MAILLPVAPSARMLNAVAEEYAGRREKAPAGPRADLGFTILIPSVGKRLTPINFSQPRQAAELPSGVE